MRKPRTGVTLLAVLSLVNGIVSLYAGAALLLVGTVAGAVGSTHGPTVMMLGAVMFALGPASFLLGFGFWTARPWAWSSAFGVLSVNLIVDVASVAVGAGLLTVVASAALSVALMVYLRRPETRAALRRPSAEQVPTKA